MTERRRSAPESTSPLAAATTAVVTELARSAASELAKGGRPFGEVARTAAADAVGALDRRAPKLAEEAGIVNWRYALLGWLTWQVGKRVVKRKAKAAAGRLAPSTNGEEE